MPAEKGDGVSSIGQRSLRLVVAVAGVASLCLSAGCHSESASAEALSYFEGLAGQQYWQRSPNALALTDEEGAKELVLAERSTSEKEQYLVFGDVTGASGGQGSRVDATLKVVAFDGTVEREVSVRVDDANWETLAKALSDSFESGSQREQRLKDEAYAGKIKEADAALAANRAEDAIAALKSARAISDTDDVKVRLDKIYLQQGEYYYGQKKYDIALTHLKLVFFDPASLSEAQELLQEVQAEADKAAEAAEKAAAQRAATAKAAAEKAAAEKAAAEKLAKQGRLWFNQLDGFYREFEALYDKLSTLSGLALGSKVLDLVDPLYERIDAYCASHKTMEPQELDEMRSTLSEFVGNQYASMLALASSDIDSALKFSAWAQIYKAGYLKARATVVEKYGY